MAVTIRDAAEADAPLLTRIIRESFRDVAVRFGLTPENCPTHPSNCIEAWITASMDRGVRYFILEEDGAPCGCVAVERAKPDVCYLEGLSVLPGYRRRGHGERLVRRVLEEAGQLGARWVDVSLIEDHLELRNWYFRLGFRMKQIKQYPHLPFTVAFMRISPRASAQKRSGVNGIGIV